jgi:hypothetical protein
MTGIRSSIRKDGAGISVEFTIVPLTDEAGRLNGVAAIMRDVINQSINRPTLFS